MSTVLVTGGAGYVGSHCCKEFARRGWNVVVYDNLSRGWRDMVRWGPLIEGDIRNVDAVDNAITQVKPDVVAHFAAVAYVEESTRRPDLYWSINAGGTMALLEAMRRSDVNKLIFSSTCATYGVPNMLPIVEDAPQNPINPYGWSKLCAERMVMDDATAYDLKFAILRYFNAAGASPDGDIGERHEPETHVIPLAIEGVVDATAAFTIHGNDLDTRDGTCVRDYVHVMDLARAHVLAADRLLAGSSSLVANLGTGKGVTVQEIADAVEAASGCSLPRRVGPRRSGDPPTLVASAERARELLDWTAAESTPRMIIESAWAWACKEKRRLKAVLTS